MNRVRVGNGSALGLVAALGVAACVLLPSGASAVQLDSLKRIDAVLSDGTAVTLYGVFRQGGGIRDYYYLPVNLRVATNKEGDPAFTFLKFTTEESEAKGGVSGALMHFLMEWGLTGAQKMELEQILEREHNGAKLKGAIEMHPANNDTSGGFKITSAVMEDRKLTPAVVTSGKAPLIPGGKAAVAARLDKHGAQLMAATLEPDSAVGDVSLTLNFSYRLMVPGARGTISINWSKIQEHQETIVANYSRTKSGRESNVSCFIFCFGSDKQEYSYSYNEMRNQFDFLQEQKYVTVDFVQGDVPDEQVAKIRDAFFQYFLNAMTEVDKSAAEDTAPPDDDDKKKEKTPDIKHGNRYSYRKTDVERSVKRGTTHMTISYDASISYDTTITGNIKDWYARVKDNPKCVSEVRLSDPFFQHRDVTMVLDLDAKEMFDKAINYVTVNVRKLRPGDPDGDFKESVLIDKKYIETEGIRAALEYSRSGTERDTSDIYEYQAQWSIKGGNVYPENPPWQKGSWEGITLAPPVVPRLIEVEADLAQLQASDISRVTVQVRYYQFGREEEENIHISPAQGESLVSKTVFNDRGAKGYAYRLVVNHKKEGKLALPWSSQVGDNYVFAQIPDDLFQEPTLLEEAKVAGAAMAKEAKVNVLSRFEGLLVEGDK
jgi:hypothetical protein